MTNTKTKLARLSKSLKDDASARADLQKISTDVMTLAVAGLSSKSDSKIVQYLSYGTSLMTVATSVRRFVTFYQRHTKPDNFTITIDEDDRIYELVEDWFKATLPEDQQRSVNAFSYYGNDDKIDIDYNLDCSYKQSIEIDGHRVEIFTETRDLPEKGSAVIPDEDYKASSSLNIICDSLEARAAVLAKIKKEVSTITQAAPKLWIATKFGDFRNRGKLANRSSKSVILKEGQFDRIQSYLNDFISNEKAYNKLDIPFRTGIMLHGAPGTGKSSAALAIANELNMDVFVINVAAMASDDNLSIAFSNVPKKSIVVLEDIDGVKATGDRKKGKDTSDSGGVTLQGLLNVLDGFQSPYGVITIMTTNHPELLDEAVKRPGRVDFEDELSPMDSYQLRKLCEYALGFVPDNLPEITPEDNITSASVMGVIRKFVPDFHESADDVVEFITKKISENLDKELTLV
jgi:ATPase family associated with various cellular activities (AAA)